MMQTMKLVEYKHLSVNLKTVNLKKYQQKMKRTEKRNKKNNKLNHSIKRKSSK